METKAAQKRSSYLPSYPVLGVNLILCVLAAVKGWSALSAVLLGLLILGALARLWAFGAAKRLTLTVSGTRTGLFPGETLELSAEIENDKLLPVPWMELSMPVPENRCLVPEEHRVPAEWEIPALTELGASAEIVGEKRFGLCSWYEKQSFPLRFSAEHRGLCELSHWRIRTGDGFGLMQVERPLPPSAQRSIAVYPRLVGVDEGKLLQNLWNSDTGRRGIMEDPTVIRSTREYLPADSAKYINFRLAARGLPLQVNRYEDILPQSLHFLFDGESFALQPEELEEALSILASLLTALTERRVRCGVSLSAGKNGERADLFAPAGIEELLRSLAGYAPEGPEQRDDGTKHLLPARFDTAAVLSEAQHVGRFFYIARTAASLERQTELRSLAPDALTLLTWENPRADGEALSLLSLRKEARS